MPDLLTDKQTETATLWFTIPANMIFSCFGLVANLAIVLTFSKMTPKDTMTISLMALSASDIFFFGINFTYFITTVIYVSGYSVLFNIMDVPSLQAVLLAWRRPLFHKISTLIMALVSVERSFCVIKPFLVRQIFTKKRVIAAISLICVVMTSVFMPVYVNAWFVWGYPNNRSQPILVKYYTADKFKIESVIMYISIGLIWSAQIVILTTTILMARGLRRHQKLRRSMTGGGAEETEDYSAVKDNKSVTGSTETKETKSDTTPQQASQGASLSKELRLIKTVFTLAIMHTVMNCPLSVFYGVHVTVDGFRPFGEYHNLNAVVRDIVFLIQSLSGVFNIFVYLTLNTKFRGLFKEIFIKCSYFTLK